MSTDNDLISSIGAKILELRNALKLNQEDFGARHNVSRSSQASYEKGNIPSGEYLISLAIKDDVDLNELLIDAQIINEGRAQYKVSKNIETIAQLTAMSLNILEEELHTAQPDEEMSAHSRCKFAIAVAEDAIREFPNDEEGQLKLIRYGAKITAKLQKEKELP